MPITSPRAQRRGFRPVPLEWDDPGLRQLAEAIQQLQQVVVTAQEEAQLRSNVGILALAQQAADHNAIWQASLGTPPAIVRAPRDVSFPVQNGASLTAPTATTLSLGHAFVQGGGIRLRNNSGQWVWKQVGGGGVSLDLTAANLDGVTTDITTTRTDEFFWVYAYLDDNDAIRLQVSVTKPGLGPSLQGHTKGSGASADEDFIAVGYFAFPDGGNMSVQSLVRGPKVGSLYNNQGVGFQTADFTATTTSATLTELFVTTLGDARMPFVLSDFNLATIVCEGYCSNGILGNRSQCRIRASNASGAQAANGPLQNFNSSAAGENGNFSSGWSANFAGNLYYAALLGAAPDGGTSTFVFRFRGHFWV